MASVSTSGRQRRSISGDSNKVDIEEDESDTASDVALLSRLVVSFSGVKMWNYSLKVNSPLLTSNLNLIEIDRQFRPRRVDMVFLQFGHSKAAQNQEEYSLHASYATIRGISLMFVCVCVVCVKCVGKEQLSDDSLAYSLSLFSSNHDRFMLLTPCDGVKSKLTHPFSSLCCLSFLSRKKLE